VSDNPYLQEISANLPRLLALFDSDRTSASYGMGDRYHWAWGLIDFGNATFQGAAHGMARLWAAGLWPYGTSQTTFLARIDALVQAAIRLTRHDGSLEEAFPHEGSYCVTALVAFDLLCTQDLLDAEISAAQRAQWQAAIKPMIHYLIKADETHALISNHLATAAAALARWHRLTGEGNSERKARQLIDRILAHQSSEGWFREYQGADPGYQSLCTYYLADLHRTCPNWNLLEPLRQSIRFLHYFAHPDGSFGGLYGSRCTRFYYPAGVLALAGVIPEAQALANFMATAISQRRTVTLSAIDEPNLIPMFNAYAWAAAQSHQQTRPSPVRIPAITEIPFRCWYPQAGLLIDRGPRHYSIISTHKGGVVYHFAEDKPPLIDAGLVLCNSRGLLGSTQTYNPQNLITQSKTTIEITATITSMLRRQPSPTQFLIIRLLSLTAFRSSVLREWIKRRLVNLLITRKLIWPATNKRIIQLGQDLSIDDRTTLTAGVRKKPLPGSFVPIHMASQGYWQIQDESSTYDPAI
jgi:hypothetical protein